MHIISRKRLNEFAERHPDAKPSLAHWCRLARQVNFSNFAELRAAFPSSDRVGKLTVFNVGGNNIRVIAAIHYNRKKIFIRAVLTHAEYDEHRWKE